MAAGTRARDPERLPRIPAFVRLRLAKSARAAEMPNDVRDNARLPFDAERVRAVARLARLELADSEVDRLSQDLGRIVALVATLPDEGGAHDDETELPPTVRAIPPMPLRRDERRTSLDRALVLAEAPRALDGGFAVPTFVDEG